MSPRALRAALLAIFLAGLAVGGAMLYRAQAGGDQLNLLARGWLWAARGEFVPYGNPLSNQGNGPGPLTTVLVGLPLFFWADHRAPIVLVLLAHVAAYLLMDAALKRILSPRERLWFALLYWLNPWRVYFSGFLWNPNYLFLAGAVHLSTAWVMRAERRFWPTFAHALAVGLAFELHPSFVILALASLLLFWRRYLRVHWGGLALAVALVLATMLPWAAAARADPSILPGGSGFPFRGLLLVFPLLRGVWYWLRHASLSVSGAMTSFDFSEALANDRAAVAGATARAIAAIGSLSVLAALAANLRFVRWMRRHWRARGSTNAQDASPRAWLRGYLGCTLVGALLAYAVSPTTIMMWQGLIVLHAAVLVVVLWCGAVARTRRGGPWVRRLVPAWTAIALSLCVAMAFGGRHYRCHGKELMGVGLTLRSGVPNLDAMLEDLGLVADCRNATAPGGWKPDVL